MNIPKFNQYEMNLADELGPILYKQETGRALADIISDLVPRSILIANFEAVEVVGASFLITAFQGLRHHVLRGREENPMLVLSNINPQIDEELDLVLASRRSPVPAIAVSRNGQVELIGGQPQINQTFDAAKKLTSR